MAIEEMMRTLLTATPQKRREVEEVLKGKTAGEKTSRLVGIGATAKLLDVSRSTVAALIRAGRLDAVSLGGRARRVTMQSIRELADGKRNGETERVKAERQRRHERYLVERARKAVVA